MRIAAIEPLILNVSEKTNWFFIRVTAENGLSGIGEASLNGWETAQLAVAENLHPQWLGKSVDALLALGFLCHPNLRICYEFARFELL